MPSCERFNWINYGNVCRVTSLRLGLFTFILETFAAFERDENLLFVHDWVLSWVRKGCGEMVSVTSDGEKCFHYHAVGEVSGEIVWMEAILIHVSISTMNFPFITASYWNLCNSAESFSLLLLSSARIKFPLSWIIRREKFVERSATKVFANMTNLAVNYKELSGGKLRECDLAIEWDELDWKFLIVQVGSNAQQITHEAEFSLSEIAAKTDSTRQFNRKFRV